MLFFAAHKIIRASKGTHQVHFHSKNSALSIGDFSTGQCAEAERAEEGDESNSTLSMGHNHLVTSLGPPLTPLKNPELRFFNETESQARKFKLMRLSRLKVKRNEL